MCLRFPKQCIVGYSLTCPYQHADWLEQPAVLPIAYNYVFHCHTISLILVLDSWGRPEAGLLTGVTNWIGDYSECTSSKSISKDSPSQFQGKYCTGMHPTSVPVNGQVSVTVVVFELWSAYVLHSTSNGKGSSIFTHCVVLNRSSPMQFYLKRSTSLIWLR